jgi:hypothetical protein
MQSPSMAPVTSPFGRTPGAMRSIVDIITIALLTLLAISSTSQALDLDLASLQTRYYSLTSQQPAQASCETITTLQ